MYKAIAFTLLFGFKLIAAQYPIGNRSLTFVDSSRSNRNIPLEIYYPAETAGTNTFPALGLFPVITFGHGFVMGVDAYYNFRDTLVPNGYVIALVNTETSFGPNHLEYAKDLLFVNNQIRHLCANDPGFFLYPFFNGKSGIMGHSMGGGCTFLAGSLASPGQVDCIAGYAPAETTPGAIAAIATYDLPTIIFSGSADGVTPPPQHHIPMYDSSASSCKFFVDITGGAHCYFANTNLACDFGESASSSGISVTRADQQRITFMFLNPWLEYYLQNDSQGLNTLVTRLQSSTETDYQLSCGSVGIEEQGNWLNYLHWNIEDHVLSIECNKDSKGGALLYSIQNITGQLLLNKQAHLKSGERVTESLIAFSPGIYLLKLQMAKKSKIFKIALN